MNIRFQTNERTNIRIFGIFVSAIPFLGKNTGPPQTETRSCKVIAYVSRCAGTPSCMKINFDISESMLAFLKLSYLNYSKISMKGRMQHCITPSFHSFKFLIDLTLLSRNLGIIIFAAFLTV